MSQDEANMRVGRNGIDITNAIIASRSTTQETE